MTSHVMVLPWQIELKESLRTAEELFQAGLISELEVSDTAHIIKKYQFLLPRYYANLIDKNNPDCPIRLQAIPNLKELNVDQNERPDPLSDLKHQPSPHITHRYASRVLLHLTANCSMYCRFCFRKTLLNELQTDLFGGSTDQAFQYLEEHKEIDEVIFSGGDPFLLTDSNLSIAIDKLNKIPHLQRLRFHSRVPVTLPSRITDELISVLRQSLKTVVTVTHFNHSKEITAEATEAIQKLKKIGVVLNQSVLLENVNTDATVLKELSLKLFEVGVMPYYLHHPDPSTGTSYFSLSIEKGKAIYHELRKILPGYLVPRYVVDEAKTPYKTLL